MKKIIIISLFIIFKHNTTAQDFKVKDSLIDYFDYHIEEIDPIEGIWILNVERTLYYNDSVITTEIENLRSEWAVIKESKLRFKVIDIGESENEKESANFYAYFEKLAIKNIYTYKCYFKDPDWEAKSSVRMFEKKQISYGYFVSEKYLKNTYKEDYNSGMKLYWSFNWLKKYPFEEQKTINHSYEWKSSGSGIFIDKRGYIATNYHVIVDAENIDIELTKNDKKIKYNAEVIATDKEHDLAILKINDSKPLPFYSIPYKILDSQPIIGTQVFALGYPLTDIMGSDIKFTDGRISSKNGSRGDISTFQTTTPLQPGSSGGPLFDFNGNLIGINSSHLKPEFADNVSYSIKPIYLKNLANKLPEKLHLQYLNRIENKTLIQKVGIVSDYVVFIKVR